MTAHIHTLFDTATSARLSASDYIASPQREQKSDLVKEGFTMASPASHIHELILPFLAGVFGNFANYRHLGELTRPNAAVEIISPGSRQCDTVEKFVNYDSNRTIA